MGTKKITKAKLVRELEVRCKQVEKLKRADAERKQALKALRKSEEKWRSLVENAPNYVIIVGRDGTIEFINRVEAGVSVEETIGKTIYNYVGPEYHDKIKETLERVFQTGETAEYESSVVLPDGRRWWYVTRAGPIKQSGRVVSVVLISTDITKRKKAENVLRESEKRYRLLLGSITDGVQVQDREFRYLLVNDELARMVQMPKEKLLGSKMTDLFPGVEETVFFKTYKKVLETGEPGVASDEFIFEDGRRVWFEVHAYPAPEGILVIVPDITERKRLEKERRIYREKLISLASELSVTEERERHRIATELHDRIGQSLVLVKMKLGELRTSLTGSASDEAGEISKLIDRTICETRSLTYELSPPILYELDLEAALEWFGEHMEKRYGIRIKVDSDGQSKALDEDIRALLFRVVQELLVNVAKHAQVHEAEVSIRRKNHLIRISVEDDGIGFHNDEVLSRVGETGCFGLFSIRERLAGFSGSFQIKSAPGHGTQATLAVPLRRDERVKERKQHDYKSFLGR